MIGRLEERLPPERAAYLAHVLSAAFYAVALVGVVILVARRGPVLALEAAAG